MSRNLNVHLLPSLTSPEALAGGEVVVVDVLRATTTIIYALAHGAREVFPCLEIDEARALAQRLPGLMLLGGERQGLRIEGFDLGNSPVEYTPERVRGRSLAFSTSNGTRAMRLCGLAHGVMIGAFVNLSAVCDRASSGSQLHVLCAGTDGQITREDVLFAGAVASELQRAASDWTLNDAAEIALGAWRQAERDMKSLHPLAEQLRASRGGRNLIEIGHERDIAIAAEIDRFTNVPRLDIPTWRIT